MSRPALALTSSGVVSWRTGYDELDGATRAVSLPPASPRSIPTTPRGSEDARRVSLPPASPRSAATTPRASEDVRNTDYRVNARILLLDVRTQSVKRSLISGNAPPRRITVAWFVPRSCVLARRGNSRKRRRELGEAIRVREGVFRVVKVPTERVGDDNASDPDSDDDIFFASTDRYTLQPDCYLGRLFEACCSLDPTMQYRVERVWWRLGRYRVVVHISNGN